MAEIKTYVINDNWTDLGAENKVAVMSVDGEIDKVYINGEEAGGGSSDFSTAEVTMVIAEGESITIPYAYDDEPYIGSWCIIFNSGVYNAILYKGYCIAVPSPSGTVIVSGEAVFDEQNSVITITGDCSITIS